MAAGQHAVTELRTMIPAEVREPEGSIQYQRTDTRCARSRYRPPAGRRHPRQLETAGDAAALQGYPNKLRALFKALIDNAIEP